MFDRRDPDMAERLVNAAGADPDAGGLQGQTPLTRALELDDWSGLVVLLEGGADPFKRDGTGRTPFDYVVSDAARQVLQMAASRVVQQKRERASEMPSSASRG